MKVKTLCLTLLLMLCIALPASVFAQTSPPNDPRDTNTNIPFDGGISVIIATGVAYAIKKGREKRKKDTQDK